jgi:Transposase DDE domain
MGRQATGGMHVDRVRSRHTSKSGEPREYESRLLRRSFRKPDGRVGKETLANLSALPAAAVDAVEAVLKGATLVDAGAALSITRSRAHGHVALVHAAAQQLGLPALLGPACRERDLAYALIVSRVVAPRPKLATLAWWDDVTLGPDLGIADAPRDDVYEAMDWLLGRQDPIEAALAGRHLREGGIAMFDLSSSWVEGTHCELAARGYSRDGKKGKEQIEYGLLTDPEGRPVAIRVFAGNTADPSAFTEAVDVVRGKFALRELVLVGDRGMITSARIRALKELGGLGWITCLRAPAIRKLAEGDGPLQLSLFDQQDLAEITHPDYPGERLIACRNPLLAAERARKREDLLAATEALLAKVTSQAQAGRVRGTDKIGVRAGKVINRYKVAKHFILDIGDDHLAWRRDRAAIDAEAALDGIYIIRTPVPATGLDTPAAVTAYKNLALVERDFRSLKADDLDLRPIHHWLDDRVRGHVLICMLAAYLTWHLRAALAPLTYTDEQHPARHSPVAPARRSAHADAKAATHASTGGQPVRSFRGLLGHMATLTRSTIALGGHTFEKISDPTPAQRRAFDLIGVPIPLTLTPK